jgi:hypothetical protein
MGNAFSTACDSTPSSTARSVLIVPALIAIPP